VARGEGVTRARIAAEPIRVDLHPLFNPALDYAAFLFIALVPTLLHVFVLVMSVNAVGSELKQGTAAEWLDAAGGSAMTAVLGKLMPYAVWYTVLGIALLEVSLRSLDLSVAGSRTVLYVAVTLLVIAYQAVALLLVAVTANLRAATSVAGFVAAPAFAVAGVSFPRFAMPLAGRAWSAALPLSHYIEIQTQQVTVGAALRESAWPLAVLLLVATLLPAIALGRLSRIARDPAFWGRS
jgi:ABC-2 type transport system permease protein